MLLLVATLALKASFDTPVTYTTRAARAEVVLPELGKLAGVDLQASPQTANEILVISVKDRPLAELLPRIASVTSGEWKQDHGTLRLVPNRAVRNREDADESSRKIEAIKKKIASLAKAVDNWQETDVQTGSRALPAPEMANLKLRLNLERGLDPALIASTDARMVFATTPNAKQHPLGTGASTVIDDFIAQHNRLAASIPKADTADEETPDFNSKPIGRVAKVLLVKEPTRRKYFADDPRFSVIFFDSAGKVVFYETTPHNPGAIVITDFEDGSQTAPQIVEYRQSSKELRAALDKGFRNAGYYSLGADLWPMVMHPLQFDPLSYYQTDEVLAYAKQKGKPLVADIPDDWSVLDVLRDSRSGLVTENAVEQAVANGSDVKDLGDTTFTVLKPARPSLCRDVRVDRRSFAKLAQATEEKGVASADDICAFAIANPNISDNGYFTQLMPVVAPVLAGDNDDWPAYRFFGELSADQRSAAKVAFDALSPQQISAAEQILYAGHHEPAISSNDGQIEFKLDSTPEDFRKEPTELLPNGLKGPGFIEITLGHSAFASRVEEAGLQGVFGADDLAQAIYSRSQPVTDPNDQPMPPGKMRIGQYAIFSFSVQLRPDTTVNWSVCDYRIDKNSRIYTEADLPADFRKEIDEQLASFRDAQSDGQTIPPQCGH